MSGGRLPAGVLGALVVAAGCGGGAAPSRPPDLWLLVRWVDAPATAAEIGHEIDAEIGSRSTRAGCTVPPPPDLQVTVNDREAKSLGSEGACDWNVVFQVRGFADRGPAAVRVSDEAGLLGEAIYGALLPAPSTLLAPADGRVNAGGQVTVAVPAGLLLGFAPEGRLYWRDGPGGAAPAVSAAPAELAADGSHLTATIPAGPGTSGRATLVFPIGAFSSGGAETCVGLSSCTSTVQRVLGPIELDVAPTPP